LKLKVNLNSRNSIEKVIRELERYENWIVEKTNLLTEKLAVLGGMEATVRFSQAEYTGTNDAQVTVEPITNGWKITARGGSVFFIEFGAGVYYNGTEPYPEPRPSGVVGIGEYGKGHGKQDCWWYGDSQYTHGTPAAMPMYHATRAMEREINRIAAEVFR
jgi:hypothetical protein